MLNDPVDASRQVRGEGGLRSIQYLRALAALMVVVYHAKPRLLRMGYEGSWPEWLSCGVDIFFVISGVIMWLTTCERPMTPQQFLWRRVLRIVPLYWGVTALMVLMMVVAPTLVIGGRLDLGHTIASFAFIPYHHPVTGVFEPVLPPGWTLNYEMEFYVLFALALLAPRALRQRLVPAVLVALVACGPLFSADTVAAFYTSNVILEFGFGVLLGTAISHGLGVSPPAAMMLVLSGAVGLVATWPLVEAGVPRALLSGTCATAIVCGAIVLEASGRMIRSRVLRLLGDASYALYLTHGLALSAVAAVWTRAGVVGRPGAVVAFGIVAVLAAMVAGVAIHLWIERPLQQLLRVARRRPQLVEGMPGRRAETS